MDIVTLAAARKSGSGGDVTKQYVDEHLALKADKTETCEYPIADTTTGINPTITDSTDGYVQNLTVYGRSDVSKNLANYLQFEPTTTNGITFTWVNSSRIHIQGTATNNAYMFAEEFTQFRLKPGTYTLTNNLPALSANGYMRIYKKDTAGWEKVYDYIRENVIATFTLQNDADIWLQIIIAQGQTINQDVTVMLELGSTATPYEPNGIISIGDSGSLTITTANPGSSESSTATLTTGLPYCGIPVETGETYTDEQGQKWLADTAGVEGVVKRCGVVDLGDFTWDYDSTYHRFYTTLTNVEDAGSRLTPMVCATYTVISDGRAIQNIPDKSIYTVSITLYIHDSAYTDAAEFKTAVTGVKLVYPLATPTTQELTPTEKSALLALRTFDSTTNVTITDDPTSIVGYLLNTDNGQAVADAIDNAITGVLNTSY